MDVVKITHGKILSDVPPMVTMSMIQSVSNGNLP